MLSNWINGKGGTGVFYRMPNFHFCENGRNFQWRFLEIFLIIEIIKIVNFSHKWDLVLSDSWETLENVGKILFSEKSYINYLSVFLNLIFVKNLNCDQKFASQMELILPINIKPVFWLKIRFQIFIWYLKATLVPSDWRFFCHNLDSWIKLN